MARRRMIGGGRFGMSQGGVTVLGPGVLQAKER